MNANWQVSQLGEVFEIARGGSPRPIENFITDDERGLNWIKIGDASASGKYIEKTKEKIRREGLSKTRYVEPGDFLLTNSMSFGRPYIMATDGCIHDGWLVLKPRKRNSVHPDYFYYLLGSERLYKQFEARAGGSTVKNLNSEIVSNIEVRLPPLDEQRRIAAILDKTDALRRKRKRALDLLGSLVRSIFQDMFGELNHYPVNLVGQSLLTPFRNGLSPAKAGTFRGKVLTLSAITGGTFNAGATKEAMFANEPSVNQRVAQGEFLICRGNGNRSLVGMGVFVPRSMPDTLFPDTIIAGQIDPKIFHPRFFEDVWNGEWVRSQIEKSARTTNGTFKVNQSGLESIRIPMPDISLQKAYGEKVAAIRHAKAIDSSQHDLLMNLFSSLQHRAFSGQL